MRKFLSYILLSITASTGFSQSLVWEKRINFIAPSEVIFSVDQSEDSNIVFCGTGTGYTYFFKTDLNGDTLWKKNKSVMTCYNGEFIYQSRSNGLMHFGNKNVDGSCTEINSIIQKLDDNGNVISSKEYGNNNLQNITQGFRELPGGGFLVSGDFGTSIYDYKLSILKTNTSGDSIWFKTFRSPSFVGNVLINQKGNYIAHSLVGDEYINPVLHPYFVELTPDGDSLHSKYIIVKADSVDEEMIYDAAIVTTDGNYLFATEVDSVQSRNGTILDIDAMLVLLDSAFNIKWKVALEPIIYKGYRPCQVLELKDSTFIVVISSLYFPETFKFHLYKISKDGQILDYKTFASSVCSQNLLINGFELLSDSSLVVTGSCSDAGITGYIARISGVGLPAIADTCKTFKANFTAEQTGDTIQIVNTSNGGYAYAWQSEWKFSDSTTSASFNPKLEVSGVQDSIWARLIATNPYGCKDTIEKKVKVNLITDTTNPSGEQDWKVIVYPNPSLDIFNFKNSGNSSTRYKLTLINSIGQQVGSFNFDSKEFLLDTGLSDGMYFYLLTDEKGNRRRGKLVVE